MASSARQLKKVARTYADIGHPEEGSKVLNFVRETYPDEFDVRQAKKLEKQSRPGALSKVSDWICEFMYLPSVIVLSVTAAYLVFDILLVSSS